MLFNSWVFALFLPATFCIYWWLRPRGVRAQNLFLLAASYVFYGWWDYRFLSLIAISSTVDYLVGLGLDRNHRPLRRKLLLVASIATNIGILGFFKYFDFFLESSAALLTSLGVQPNVYSLRVILPVGISFYTFQTLSYTIDVYRGRVPPTRDAIAFFAFVSFFPQLVAGPIERAKSLLPQFLKPRNFELSRAKDGVRQMLWGFFKKVVIADNVAGPVEAIFSNSADFSGFSLYLGVFLFAIQIYCDFSGYSDIAIGTGRLFGFSLMRNFAYPYFARNIAEFWRRWHISLSTWFRDYVYIPLGGSRVGSRRHQLNVLATFTLSGLWHGANWTFVVWGFLNGLYFLPLIWLGSRKKYEGQPAAERLLPRPREAVAMAVTFYATLLAWVFFRSESLSHAMRYISGLVPWRLFNGIAYPMAGLAPTLVLIALLLVAEWLQRNRLHALQIEFLPRPVRWAAYVTVGMAIVFLGSLRETEFIYFQF